MRYNPGARYFIPCVSWSLPSFTTDLLPQAPFSRAPIAYHLFQLEYLITLVIAGYDTHSILPCGPATFSDLIWCTEVLGDGNRSGDKTGDVSVSSVCTTSSSSASL